MSDRTSGSGTGGAPAGGATDPIGLAAILGALSIWGFAVLFFKALEGVPPIEVICHRIVWTSLFVGLWLAATGRLGEVRAALTTPSVLARLTLSALLIGGNWLVFVWAIGEARVLEVSFGYFITPIATVGLGYLVLGERGSRRQAIALGLAVLAISVQATGLTGFPFVSLFLALSFSVYGLIRKTVDVRPSPGLLVESLLLAPLAIGYLVWLDVNGTGHFLGTPATTSLLVATGIITALPLILFATGARRLPLSTVGILHYLSPSIHFLLAVTVLGEPLTTIRLASFAIIWISLAVFASDLLARRRSGS
ncbi:MAG: EamA family transporter RarD [Hyphomicrobiales bacterium]